MKKILTVFLVLLLAGCIPSLEDTQDMMKEGYTKLRAELQKDLGVDEYNMQEGDYITVGGMRVTLEIFDADYVVVFDVDGHKREMRETQDPQIVNGVELTILWRKFDASDMEGNYVKVRAKKYAPNIDEYVFYLEDEKQILGHTVSLIKLNKDGSVSMKVDDEEVRIMEDKQEGIRDIYISNIRPNYRAIASERYVILKITQKP